MLNVHVSVGERPGVVPGDPRATQPVSGEYWTILIRVAYGCENSSCSKVLLPAAIQAASLVASYMGGLLRFEPSASCARHRFPNRLLV